MCVEKEKENSEYGIKAYRCIYMHSTCKCIYMYMHNNVYVAQALRLSLLSQNVTNNILKLVTKINSLH